MPTERLFRWTLSETDSDWKIGYGGQLMKWYKISKTLTSLLARVGPVTSPGWGPWDPSPLPGDWRRDMAQSRSQWRSWVRNLSFSTFFQQTYTLENTSQINKTGELEVISGEGVNNKNVILQRNPKFHGTHCAWYATFLVWWVQWDITEKNNAYAHWTDRSMVAFCRFQMGQCESWKQISSASKRRI